MDYAAQQREPSKHLLGMAIVVLLHLIVGYAIVTGLANRVVDVVRGPIETKIIKELKPPPPDTPPPPPPKLTPPPPAFIPPPEINIAQTAPVTNTITAVTHALPPVAAPQSRPAASVTAPVVKASGCREPDYPPSSARLGEAGRVVLQLLVGVDGRVTDSKIETSSGFPKLDEAARKALSLCKFQPGTADGKPVPSWSKMAYVFKNPND